MKNKIIYVFPLLLDIVVSLALFVSRHSFAEKGMSVTLVGAVSVIYGAVYILSSLIMRKIITPALAKVQMLVSTILLVILLVVLANLNHVYLILLVFCGVPFSTNMFFNAFQAFMLDVDTGSAKPLSRTAGHYTFAWSLGFALGPIISSVLKTLISWSAAYYVAALLAMGVGVVASMFKPGSVRREKADTSKGNTTPADEKAFPLAGWLGGLTAFTGWIAIATYWPIQAEQIGFSAAIKGSVEFIFAVAQALSAFVVCSFPRWYHRPLLLPLPAAAGIVGLGIFAFSKSALFFIVGAGVYGIFTGSSFTYMVYHAMFVKEQAVKRVAINEIMVGISLISGPLLAAFILARSSGFMQSYLVMALLAAVGVSIQVLAARAGIKKGDAV